MPLSLWRDDSPSRGFRLPTFHTVFFHLPLAPFGHGSTSVPPPAVTAHDTPSNVSFGHFGASVLKRINVHGKLKIKRTAHEIQTFICSFLLGKAQSEDSFTVKEEERDGKP